MPIALSPSTSFTTTITDAATSNRSVYLPNVNGTLAGIANTTSSVPKFSSSHTSERTITLPDRDISLTSGLERNTAVAASGTSVNFSIPNYVKKVVMVYNSISTNGTSLPIIRIGSGGSPATTGYDVFSGYYAQTSSNTQDVLSFTDGFRFYGSHTATQIFSGILTLYNIDANQWQGQNIWRAFDTNRLLGSAIGFVTLPGTLNIIAFTTIGGVNTFDAGTINVFYE